jgi:hypothetical protein
MRGCPSLPGQNNLDNCDDPEGNVPKARELLKQYITKWIHE